MRGEIFRGVATLAAVASAFNIGSSIVRAVDVYGTDPLLACKAEPVVGCIKPETAAADKDRLDVALNSTIVSLAVWAIAEIANDKKDQL